jgi:predicted N-acetyltransferase YhbS
MDDIEIRLMRDQDWERVLAILGHWGMAPVEPSVDCPEPEHSGLEVGKTLVATAGGRVVGVASYRLLGKRLASTESLAVDPDWIGCGAAEKLQLARLATMRLLGIERVRTTADRPRTITWYVKRFGYRITGVEPKRHPFGVSGVPDWTVLELDLVDGAPAGRSARARRPDRGGSAG